MRMRKLKWAHDLLMQAEVVAHEPAQLAGRWKQQLNCETLHVEIGCGKGDYWVGMGVLYPQIGWIGIEKNESAAGLSVRKFEESMHSEAMSFIWGDAEQIDAWFETGEVDAIHLNFSDPWPKKRTTKRRLSNSRFLKKYERILSDKGQIIMKTDNSALFEYSLLEFAAEGWELYDISVDFRREPHDEDVITEYERRFMEKGQPIYRAIWNVPSHNHDLPE